MDGTGIFTVDTTFQLVDNLWLTDSTYPNLSLLDSNGKRESYRRFCGEITLANPELRFIKKVGHDLDKAISGGLNDVLFQSKHFWCTRHLQEADSHKINKLSGNKRTANRIMSDIYGTLNGPVLEFGLADAEDADDFKVKLHSLKETWNDLLPGFHSWFVKYLLTVW